MLHIEVQSHIYVSLPFVHCLIRETIYQINADIVNTCIPKPFYSHVYL